MGQWTGRADEPHHRGKGRGSEIKPGIVFLLNAKHFPYSRHDQPQLYLADVSAACNFECRFQTRNGRPANTSAEPGLQGQTDLSSIRSTTCRDWADSKLLAGFHEEHRSNCLRGSLASRASPWNVSVARNLHIRPALAGFAFPARGTIGRRRIPRGGKLLCPVFSGPQFRTWCGDRSWIPSTG